MNCNDSGIGSLKICVGSANKKLETQQDQICQAFLFNLQFTIADTEIGRDPSSYWYPTLTMSLEIKKLLPPGGVRWLLVRAQVKEVKDGRMDAEVMIFDQGMGLVALSHQTCSVVENSKALKQKQRVSTGKL